MGSDWIKVEASTPEKPEVIAIAERLRLDPDAAFGKLLRFWMWADAQTADGKDLPVSEAWVDRKVQCKGFAAAMRAVGWLTGEPAGPLTIPSFGRHMGKSAKARAETQRRMTSHRERRRTRDANVTADASLLPNESAPTASPEREGEEENLPLRPPPGEPAVAVVSPPPSPVRVALMARVDSVCTGWQTTEWTEGDRRTLDIHEAKLATVTERQWALLRWFWRQPSTQDNRLHRTDSRARLIAEPATFIARATNAHERAGKPALTPPSERQPTATTPPIATPRRTPEEAAAAAAHFRECLTRNGLDSHLPPSP